MCDYKFNSAWWLPGGHLQTLWASLKKRKENISLTRERLELPDGDFIDLDWTEGSEKTPLVLVLHGLEGSIQSTYAKGMLSALKNSGFRAIFMHFRGCSEEHNRSSKSYHAGETGDLSYVLRTLSTREPSIPIAAIGFSLGANVLLKYLGETKTDSLLSCAVSISTPFLLNRSADKLQKGFSKIYQKYLLTKLQKKILDKDRLIKSPINLSNLSKINDFWKFDDLITAKLNGFNSAQDYYKKSSSSYYLSDIKRPTLLLQALNDPFLYPDAIPSQGELPTHVQLELYKSGGHMGFIMGSLPWQPKYWLEERVPAYIKKILQENYQVIP